MSEQPLPDIEGRVIMWNQYYDPKHLRDTLEWAKERLKPATPWESQFLIAEIKRIETALATGRAE